MITQPPLLQGVATEIAESRGLKLVGFAGQGAFKETYRAQNNQGHHVALKVLDRQKCDLIRTEREITAMQRCESPYVARLLDHGTYVSSSGMPYDYVIEEYFDGGTLGSQLARGVIDVQKARKLAVPLLEALGTLKRLKIVHRDIKPENVMYRAGSDLPVLVDFGLVRDLSETSLTLSWLPQGPGTPFFAAPEQLNNEKGMISWRSDQFSLGVMLAICLTGRHPYAVGTMSPGQIVNAVAERRCVSEEFKAEMEACGFAVVVRMVNAWPVRRFATPEEIICKLNTA